MQGAVNASTSGDRVELQKDVSEVISIRTGIVLDLGGNTLSGRVYVYEKAVRVEN